MPSKFWKMHREQKTGQSAAPSSKTRSRRTCAVSTRAASSSTTRSRRCTSRCAARTPTRRSTGWGGCWAGGAVRFSRRRASRAGGGEAGGGEGVFYMGGAAKSNAVYAAYNAARDFIAGDASRPVPMHIRNAPTRLMKGLGYGRDYRYAHDEEDAFAAGENYFPEGMPEVEWYRPADRGLEQKIREKLQELRRRNAAAPKSRK